MKGLIIMYNKDKGYGFVKDEDNQEYHFKDRAIAFGEMPEKGRHCEFEANPVTGNGKKKPSITTLKILAATTPAPPKLPVQNQTTQRTYRDDRITCPYCNRKMVPRITYWYGMHDRSLCPFCMKVVDVSDEPVRFITYAVVGIALLGLLFLFLYKIF